MSEFQKSLFQKKLKRLELQLGLDFSEDAEEGGATDSYRIPLAVELVENAKDEAQWDQQLPTWEEYFDENKVYEIENGFKINTYYKKPVNNNKNPIVFVCHHGAGSSGLTFGNLSESLQRKFSEKNKSKLNTQDYELPGLFSFDMRGHSKTADLNDKETNYSMEVFSSDFVSLLTTFVDDNFDQDFKPSIFLVGHSLGGSILTNVIFKGMLKDLLLDTVKGLAMLDIVEEAAIQSLHAMVPYLDKMPKKFQTLQECIQWHLDSKLVNNEQSAKLSVPSYFKFDSDSKTYRWSIDLYETQPFWEDWFKGLSSNFVSIKSSVAKLLILSGHDNLDKYLMIGQMQGKYQLVVFQNQIYDPTTGKLQYCGHFVQEDCPDKVAITLIDFVERNDITRNDKQINIKWGSMR